MIPAAKPHRAAAPATLGLCALLMCAVPLAMMALSQGAHAQDATQTRSITIEVSKARAIKLPSAATTVFIADPSIADVQVPDPGRVVIFGKKPGTTRAYAFDGERQIASYTVHVTRPTAEIEHALKAVAPGSDVRVTSTPGGIVVNGRTATPLQAAQMKDAASQYLDAKDKNSFNVTVGASTQVNLRVRVAEVSRDVQKNFGFNWDALFNDGMIAVGLMTGRAPVSTFGTFIRDTSTNHLDSLGIGYKNSSGSATFRPCSTRCKPRAWSRSWPNPT